MHGAHQVRIKIIKQYNPLPSAIFLPIFGEISTVKQMPMELSVGQVKSLLHSFKNNRQNTHQSNRVPPSLRQGPEHPHQDDWNSVAPPPVPAERRYANNFQYGTPYPSHPGMRGPPDLRGPHPMRPQMGDRHVPGYGHPMQYSESMGYYGVPPHPYHWYGGPDNSHYPETRFHASGQPPKKTSMGYDGPKMESKPSHPQSSVAVETMHDEEKQGMDAKVRQLNLEIERYRDEHKQLHEKLENANEELRKLQQLLADKDLKIENQENELAEVRAEFFSSYDEQSARGNYQAQQIPLNSLMSRPTSPGGSQLSYQSMPTPVHTGHRPISPPQLNHASDVNAAGQHQMQQNSGEIPGTPHSDHGVPQASTARLPTPPPIKTFPQPPQKQTNQAAAYSTGQGAQVPNYPEPPNRMTSQGVRPQQNFNASAPDNKYSGDPGPAPPQGQPKNQSPMMSPRWQQGAGQVPRGTGGQPSNNQGSTEYQEYYHAHNVHQETQGTGQRNDLGPLGGVA